MLYVKSIGSLLDKFTEKISYARLGRPKSPFSLHYPGKTDVDKKFRLCVSRNNENSTEMNNLLTIKDNRYYGQSMQALSKLIEEIKGNGQRRLQDFGSGGVNIVWGVGFVGCPWGRAPRTWA